MTPRESIGFLVHPREEEAAQAGLAQAERCGFRSWSAVLEPEAAMEANAAGTRLLITVGGDGTFLYGARLAGPRGLPILGVNRGRLGFLTDVSATDLPAVIDAFAAGDFTIERRSMLAALVAGQGNEPPLLDAVALNEVAVKAQGVNVVRIRVDADGDLLGEFDSDGVVVATATGSTAYALSAGGPPVDPRVRALVVVPLAPHAVMTRAVVIPEGMTVVITATRGRVQAAADRRPVVALPEGERLIVRPGPDLQVVRFPGSPTFLRRLRDKLHYGMPLKTTDHPASQVSPVPTP